MSFSVTSSSPTRGWRDLSVAACTLLLLSTTGCVRVGDLGDLETEETTATPGMDATASPSDDDMPQPTSNGPTTAAPPTTGPSTGASNSTDDDGTTSTTGSSDDTVLSGTFLAVTGRQGFPCDVFEQDCGSGSKCTLWSNVGGPQFNDVRCSEVAPGAGAPEEPCQVEAIASGFDTCDATSVCWYVDPISSLGTCTPFCVGSEIQPSCATSDRTCTVIFDDRPLLCLQSCELSDPQGCPPGQDCVAAEDGGVCVPDDETAP